jgi:hypothetical protein
MSSQFAQTLAAIHALLVAVGETHWAKWIETDIHEWHESEDVSHHLSAYGGMGSFNDVYICAANGHSVTHHQEPWANALFDHLKALSYTLATNRGRDLHASKLVSVFDKSPRRMTGWRCLGCGHSEATNRELESFLAIRHLPEFLTQGLMAGTLKESVEAVLSLRAPEVDLERERLRKLLRSAAIPIVDRSDWMRPCPKCGSEDPAVYRWIIDGGVTPASDNLPIKNALRVNLEDGDRS